MTLTLTTCGGEGKKVSRSAETSKRAVFWQQSITPKLPPFSIVVVTLIVNDPLPLRTGLLTCSMTQPGYIVIWKTFRCNFNLFYLPENFDHEDIPIAFTDDGSCGYFYAALVVLCGKACPRGHHSNGLIIHFAVRYYPVFDFRFWLMF